MMNSGVWKSSEEFKTQNLKSSEEFKTQEFKTQNFKTQGKHRSVEIHQN